MALNGGKLNGKRVAFLFTDGVEEVELVSPLQAVLDEGATASLVSLKVGEVQAYNHLHPADRVLIDTAVADADSGDFDALVLPGGVANPDRLRQSDDALRFVKGFFEEDKPVAVICHGPWTLIDADVVKGRTLTSWPSLRVDLENAGATWVDEPVCVDHNLISSRMPDDLVTFDRTMVAVVAGTDEV